MLLVLGTYFAISVAWILGIANFFLYKYSSYWEHDVIKSLDIIYTIIFIFAVIGPAGVAILRYRLDINSLWKAIFLEFRHVIVFTIFFNGLSYHLWTAIVCHILGIEVNFGITSKEVRKTNFFQEIGYTLRVYHKCYFLMLLLGLMVIGMQYFVPENLRIRDGRSTIPLILVIIGHVFTPILLNPVLMRVKF